MTLFFIIILVVMTLLLAYMYGYSSGQRSVIDMMDDFHTHQNTQKGASNGN
jgi:mannose/fructose/N-acetylgalactosamine-specific phosphotransferase system component IID